MRKIYLFMLMAVGLLISGNLRAEGDSNDQEGIAKIGNQYYSTLQKAINDVPANQKTTIELVKDINVEMENGAFCVVGKSGNNYVDQDIILDFNTHSINVTQKNGIYKSLQVIMNYAKLEMKGEGTASKPNIKMITNAKGWGGDDHCPMFLHYEGVLTITSGYYQNATPLASCAYVLDMQSGRANHAVTFNMNGGTLSTFTTNSDYKTPVIRLYDYNASSNVVSGNLTINMNGGTINGQRAFYIDPIRHKNQIIVNITGGEINAFGSDGTDNRILDCQYEGEAAPDLVTINISGGTFDGYLYLVGGGGGSLNLETKPYLETLKISGGNFKTHNAIRFPQSQDQEKVWGMAPQYWTLTGGTFFFDATQTVTTETVFPEILLGQTYENKPCAVDFSGFVRYYGLSTKEDWTNIGYIVKDTTVTKDESWWNTFKYDKNGQWIKVSKEVNNTEGYKNFKSIIGQGFVDVDITGNSNPNKTVEIKKVDTKEFDNPITLNPTDVKETDAVVVEANVTIPTNPNPETPKEVEVYSMTVGDGGSLTIGAGSTLIVGDGGFGDNIDRKGDAINVTINSADGSFGVVKVSPDAPKTKQKVRVQLYTKAHSDYVNDDLTKAITASYWQLFARPTEMEVESFGVVNYDPSVTGIAREKLITNMYGFDGSHWVQIMNLDELDNKFEGYAISNNTPNGGVVYEFTGWMCLNDDAELKFNHGGFTLMGNSYLAPVSLKTLFEDLPEGAEKTIWYYQSNDGSFVSVTFAETLEPDAEYLSTQVEPMQGFFMNLMTGSSAEAKINYATAVWNQSLVAYPLPAPGLQAKGMNMAKITVSANGKSDAIRVYEDNDFSQAFDNGTDATKMMNLSGMFNLYVATEEQNYANYATDNLEGTILTFNANAQSEYTLSFSKVNTDYQLLDLMTMQTIEMTEGNTYTFTAEPNSTAERFQIVSPAMAPTAIKNAKSANATKILKNGMLYIKQGNNTYNAQGQNVK